MDVKVARAILDEAARGDQPSEHEKLDAAAIVSGVIAEEECRGERLANQLGLGLCAILAAVLVLNYLSAAIDGAQALVAAGALGFYGMVSVTVLLIIRWGRYHPALKYLSGGSMLLVLSGYLLYSTYHVPTTPFMASISWLYFAIIAIAGLRHSVPLILTISILSTLSFATTGVLSLTMLAADPLPARVARHATWVTLLTRVIYLLGTTGLLVYVARISRRMIVQSAVAQFERIQAVMQSNQNLEQRVRAYIAELRAAYAHQGRMVERLRIAREMHDGLATSLSGLALEAEVTVELLRRSSPRTLEHAEAVRDLSKAVTVETRQIIGDLREPTLEQPLATNLRDLAERFTRAMGIPVNVQLAGLLPELPAPVQHELVRIVEEALANVQRHAAAQHVVVRLTTVADALEVNITDDGKGFQFSGNSKEFLRAGRYGLIGMYERANRLGAMLDLTSAPEAGTTVSLRLPLASALSYRST